MRLDATARFMQDVATDDASDAGLDRKYGWLVRRTLIQTIEPARLGEQIAVSTWCAGIGRSWAERRTRIVGDRGASIDAVSLWVQVDVRTGRPARVASDFLDAYAATAAGRTVSARLALPGPDSGDCGNAVGGPSHRPRPLRARQQCRNLGVPRRGCRAGRFGAIGRAEMEYLQPVEYDETNPTLLTQFDESVTTAWLVAGTSVRAAGRWTPVSD